jgi:hypothetical protein
MGFVLDAILKIKLIEGPVTVEDGYVSKTITIDNREAEFGIQIDYVNGISPNLTVYVQTSVDGISFVDVTDSDQLLTNASDTIIYDIAGMGPSYLRLRFAGTGSIDVTGANYSGRKRH